MLLITDFSWDFKAPFPAFLGQGHWRQIRARPLTPVVPVLVTELSGRGSKSFCVGGVVFLSDGFAHVNLFLRYAMSGRSRGLGA